MRKLTFWKLAKIHALGSPWEWRNAVIEARNQGYELKTIHKAMWFHPLYAIFIIGLAVAVAIIIFEK